MSVDVASNDSAGDERLLDQTLAGNPEAFGQLVRKYQDRLCHAMTYILGSASDAEDVVQDGFVQAFVKLDSFKRNSAFYTWLYRIMVNLALSRRRRRKSLASIDEMRERIEIEPVDRGAAPDGRMRQDDNVSQVRKALSKLPEEFRDVLVLREMDDLSYDEIGQMLDLPVGTVRSRLHRARLQMRDLLKDCNA
ncbi:MAG TPA: sigma-70 family RNA polymerase sigma factor [Pirellulales bacterium]|nr:sigma-70 family RNA polymerase sigma factor [Pirellulales bacterium]